MESVGSLIVLNSPPLKEPASITDQGGADISIKYKLGDLISRMADNAHIYRPYNLNQTILNIY